MTAPALRWKRRRHGWAGFDDTSRKAVARVVRKPRRARLGVCQAYYRFRSWLRAPSIGAAIRWCEEQLRAERAPRLPRVVEALIVHEDGRAELRAVEPMPAMMFDTLPKLSRLWLENDEDMLRDLAVERVVYPLKQYGLHYSIPLTGEHGDERVLVYAHPKADERRVHKLAELELRRRIDTRNPLIRR